MRRKLKLIVTRILFTLYELIEPWLPYYSMDSGPMTDEDLPKYLWYLSTLMIRVLLLVCCIAIGTGVLYEVLTLL